jgi:hypothetical protein
VKIEHFHWGKTEYLTPFGFKNYSLLALADMAICKAVEINLVYDRLKICDGYFQIRLCTEA